MDSQPTERTAPEGAERWYHAARNPEMQSPSLDEVLRGGILFEHAGKPSESLVSVYEGASFTLDPAKLLAEGALRFYTEGLVFLPSDGTNWLKELEVPLDTLITGLVGAFLPLGNLALDAVRDVVIGELTLGELKQGWDREAEARFKHPGFFVMPFVNLEEAASLEVKGKGFFGTKKQHILLHARSQAGQELVRTVVMQGDKSWPGGFFNSRVTEEVKRIAGRIETRLTGWQEIARTELGKLELYIEGELTGDSLLHAIEEAVKAGRSKNVTTGQIIKAVRGSSETASKARKERMGETAANKELFQLVLDDLAPMLPGYRRVPAMAHTVELLEHLAAGDQDMNWAPAWKAADFPFNFAAGFYPKA